MCVALIIRLTNYYIRTSVIIKVGYENRKSFVVQPGTFVLEVSIQSACHAFGEGAVIVTEGEIADICLLLVNEEIDGSVTIEITWIYASCIIQIGTVK